MKHHTVKKAACLALSAFLMTSVLTGCGSDEAAQETVVSTIPVTAETVIMQDFEKTVTLGGLTAAENTVNVIAKVNGMEQIKAVNVKVGDKVSTKQKIGKVFTDTENDNKTELYFMLYKDTEIQNPENWLAN